eukprot:RCo015166
MKKEQCAFCGHPIHPGHGKKYVPAIVQSTRPFLWFASKKARTLFLRKKNPRKIRWTITWRKAHKKFDTRETMKEKVQKVRRIERPFAGMDLEEIKKKAAQRLEIRAKAREAALKELEKRKAKKSEAQGSKGAAAAKKAPKPRAQAPKQPKLTKMPKAKGH